MIKFVLDTPHKASDTGTIRVGMSLRHLDPQVWSQIGEYVEVDRKMRILEGIVIENGSTAKVRFGPVACRAIKLISVNLLT